MQKRNVGLTNSEKFMLIFFLLLFNISSRAFPDNSVEEVYKIFPSVNKLESNRTSDSIPNFIFGYYKNKTLMIMNGKSKVFSDFDDTIGYNSAKGYDYYIDPVNRITYLVNFSYTNAIFDGEKLTLGKEKNHSFAYSRNPTKKIFEIGDGWIYTQKFSFNNEHVNTVVNSYTLDVFSAYPENIIGFGQNIIITTDLYSNSGISLWSLEGELKYRIKDFSPVKLKYPESFSDKRWECYNAFFVYPFIIIEGEIIDLPYLKIAHINNQPPVIIDTRTDEAFFAPYGYHLFAVPTKE